MRCLKTATGISCTLSFKATWQVLEFHFKWGWLFLIEEISMDIGSYLLLVLCNYYAMVNSIQELNLDWIACVFHRYWEKIIDECLEWLPWMWDSQELHVSIYEYHRQKWGQNQGLSFYKPAWLFHLPNISYWMNQSQGWLKHGQKFNWFSSVSYILISNQ